MSGSSSGRISQATGVVVMTVVIVTVVGVMLVIAMGLGGEDEPEREPIAGTTTQSVYDPAENRLRVVLVDPGNAEVVYVQGWNVPLEAEHVVDTRGWEPTPDAQNRLLNRNPRSGDYVEISGVESGHLIRYVAVVGDRHVIVGSFDE